MCAPVLLVCCCRVLQYVHLFTMQQQVSVSPLLCYSSCTLMIFFGAGKGNKQKSKAKFKDALPLALLISVQSSPGPLLPADEWRRRVGGVGGGRRLRRRARRQREQR